MKIELTSSAVNRLAQELGNNEMLKLVYDTDGCGCAVNGIAQLWKVSHQGPDDVSADASPYPFVYLQEQEIFFDDTMKLDFRDDKKTFVLSSPSQYYNASLPLIDKT